MATILVPDSVRDIALSASESARATLERNLLRSMAPLDLLSFIEYVWQGDGPFIVGRHTRAICEELTDAVWRWIGWDPIAMQPQPRSSSFLSIECPYRHGKTEIFTIHFNPWFLGVAHSFDVTKIGMKKPKRGKTGFQPSYIMTGYGAELIQGFSKRAKMVFDTPEYKEVFPGVALDSRYSSSEAWAVKGSVGLITATGLGGSITGKGADVFTLDDYFKNRSESESPIERANVVNAFKDDLMTRRHDPCIAVVGATRWNLDDLQGWIDKQMADDPAFPRFRKIRFPARVPGQYEHLFPEKYGPEWYSEQRATLGPYSAAALLDCDPQPKGEQKFQREWFNYYGQFARVELDPQSVKWFIAVDYAGGDQDENCESVILLHAIGPDKRRYFHRYWRGRMGVFLLKNKIVEVIQATQAKWGLSSLGLERGAALVLRRWLEEEFQRSGMAVEIKGLNSGAGTGKQRDDRGVVVAGKAKMRVESLVPPYADGLIWHNTELGSEMHWDNGQNKWIDKTMRGGELERQLLSYPFTIPDDVSDVAAYALQQTWDRQPADPSTHEKLWQEMSDDEKAKDSMRRKAQDQIRGKRRR